MTKFRRAFAEAVQKVFYTKKGDFALTGTALLVASSFGAVASFATGQYMLAGPCLVLPVACAAELTARTVKHLRLNN